MASKAVVKATGNAVSLTKKHTLQSTGIWERIRRTLAIDPNRSNGVPLNPHNRNPAPGSNDPSYYTDPVTLPAGDIADNPYWKRDHRRNYPALSVVGQAEQVALLGVGSAANPRVELIGEEGSKALVAAKEEGETAGLAKFFEKNGKDVAKLVLGENGLPPLPSGLSLEAGKWDVHRYDLDVEQSYSESYPCRSFQ